MTKYATLTPAGAIDVVYLSPPGPDIAAVPIPDDAFSGFVSDGAGGWSPPPMAPPTPDDLRSHAAAVRFAVETGGVDVDGTVIDTSRDSQSMIAGALAYVQASEAVSVEFKATSGWVTLSAAQVTTIALAVAVHVQQCFAAERAVDDGIADGTITTRDQIDAWPWPGSR